MEVRTFYDVQEIEFDTQFQQAMNYWDRTQTIKTLDLGTIY